MSTITTPTSNRARVNDWLGRLKTLEGELGAANEDAFAAAKNGVKTDYEEATARVIRLTGEIEDHKNELAKSMRTPRKAAKAPNRPAAANGGKKVEKSEKSGPKINLA